MDILTEIIIDFIMTVFIDNTDNIIKDKKVSKWIRYPVICLVILLSIIFIFGPIILGILLLNKSIVASIISMLIGITFLIGIIFKVKKIIKEKNIT